MEYDANKPFGDIEPVRNGEFEIDSEQVMAAPYIPMDVKSEMERIKVQSNKIVMGMAKIHMTKEVFELESVQAQLMDDSTTLENMRKQISFMQHMCEAAMIHVVSLGTIDMPMYFQIADLAQRTTTIMSQYTVFRRSLSKYIQQLEIETIKYVETDDDYDDDELIEEYAEGYVGDEDMIDQLEDLVSEIEMRNNDILDKDLEAEVDFDITAVESIDQLDDE